MFRTKVIILILSLLFVTGCGGIKMLSNGNRDDLYGSDFLSKIEKIKTGYRRGNADSALKELQAMKEGELLPTERALRRNLIGVIYFGKSNYEQAIFNFNQGLVTSRLDENLTAQLKLNLAGSYYKLGMSEKAYEAIKDAPYESLSDIDKVKFHRLKYRLAQEQGLDDEAIDSLIWTLSGKQKISELRIDPLYEVLTSKFRKLEQTEKYKTFEKFEEKKPFVIGYLSYLEAEKVYYSGKKDEAKDLIRWIQNHFIEYGEIKTLVKNFTYKVENYAKLDPLSIGVILPLSGEKKNFGQRALFGLDAALREIKKKNPGLPDFKIIVKDSEGSGVVGAHQVKELVEKDFASVIVGGLFSLEATKEFEIAKRRGVFFVSLSQIYLDKEDKDHLLLEVPGSIESQVNELFSQKVLGYFGKKGAIVYPESKRGQAYVNEFWRRAKLADLPVTGVYSYDKKATDFRDPIKNLLGLKFPRTRSEEYNELDEIYSLEKSKSTRRIQILKPQKDFDWVFIPAFPLEAIQIIPSFTYYDAFNVPIFGGPSWRSNRLSAESYKFKNIHFIGDDVQQVSDVLTKDFYASYGKKLRLIELRAFDSMNIAINVLTNGTLSSRDELDMSIRSMSMLKGQTGNWKLVDGVWLKDMASLHFKNGKISELQSVEELPAGQ